MAEQITLAIEEVIELVEAVEAGVAYNSDTYRKLQVMVSKAHPTQGDE